MKKINLDMRHQFMSRSSEEVESPSNARRVTRHASCVICVDTYGTSLDMLIWYIDMNFHTLGIQDSVSTHSF